MSHWNLHKIRSKTRIVVMVNVPTCESIKYIHFHIKRLLKLETVTFWIRMRFLSFSIFFSSLLLFLSVTKKSFCPFAHRILIKHFNEIKTNSKFDIILMWWIWYAYKYHHHSHWRLTLWFGNLTYPCIDEMATVTTNRQCQVLSCKHFIFGIYTHSEKKIYSGKQNHSISQKQIYELYVINFSFFFFSSSHYIKILFSHHKS